MMELIPGTPEVPWSLLPPCCTPFQTDLGSASPHGGSTPIPVGRYYAQTYHSGKNADTCCCKRSCLFIAQTRAYFLETKVTTPHTVPQTQVLGWRVQQLFTLWTLSDVQSSTEYFMLCSTNRKSD